MFTKENALVAIMTITMLSFIGFAVTLFAGAFFVQAIGVAGMVNVLACFGGMALVGHVVTNKLENI